MPEQSQIDDNIQGANYNIPEAEKSIEIFDKMEAYQQQANLSTEFTQSTWSPDSSIHKVQMQKDSNTVELSALAQQNHQIPENLLAHIKQKEQELRQELAEPEQQAKRVAQADERGRVEAASSRVTHPGITARTLSGMTPVREAAR